MELLLSETDFTTTIDTIKESLEKKFPLFKYQFMKPLFDVRYLKVRKDTYVAAVVILKKGKIKIRAAESSAFSGALRNANPIVGVATQTPFNEFEQLIGTYIESCLKTKK